MAIFSLLPTGPLALDDLEAFFSSLPPSPAWAPFWDSLFDGLGTCILVWTQVYFLGMSTNITIQLAGFIAIHLVTLPIVAWHAYYGDGWTEEAVYQCLGIVPVLVLDMITIHMLYRRPRERLGM
ncbi:hypothetical protein BO83DRAFT_88515 [Aspergillus eucalypticola CBS 122712]|uniref:Uncharacterized protein n=1 Tax=Aspergillus eucalypticola (strain CBS 122712 / IBT 29274) TaxID=1448314 RepID=A0A317V5P4_ASPEC|nr:uncharacterized protein BO83DRAFT_88515 [Aspergillus eucalypticola CBS 122712]PWY68227.1 hypothetical protein BO83DRAFT_88515 [Aspergillus eucalypticola CBS 122712]